MSFLLTLFVMVLFAVLIFSGPTYLLARVFDAGHTAWRRVLLSVVAATAVGLAVTTLLGARGHMAILVFLLCAAAAMMVVLDLRLTGALGVVFLNALLLWSLVESLPEFIQRFVLPHTPQGQAH